MSIEIDWGFALAELLVVLVLLGPAIVRELRLRRRRRRGDAAPKWSPQSICDRTFLNFVTRIAGREVAFSGDWKFSFRITRLVRCTNCQVVAPEEFIGHDRLCAPCRITNHMRLFHPDHPTFWKEPHA